MKTKIKANKQIKPASMGKNGKPNYYFHADEDFREDWDWGKAEMTAAKIVSKRTNQYEL